MDRRSLLDDDDLVPDRENINLFDDSNEVDDIDFVADGFRPAYNHDRDESESQVRDLSPTRSITASPPIIPHITHAEVSRDSTRKSTGRDNPFASPDDRAADEAGLPLHRTPSGNFAPLPHRSTSSASSGRYARTHSTRFGAGGPSHPYAMYPQDTGVRASSIVSVSTVQIVSHQTSGEGPRHPYALYPQGVADDSDNEDDTVANPVPLGFLGVGQQFHRRRGPDGEEQDIMGFYGHTEQLPPYTRYPEDGPEKAPLLGIPDVPPAPLHSRAPVLGSDPGMPLMHAHIQPVPRVQSMTDESELQRQITRSSRMGESLATGQSSQDSLLTKKSWSEKSWREKRKTRFAGIPLWAFLVALGCLAFIAVVLGAVIGGFVEGQQKAERKIANAPPSTSLWDASLVATPTATSPAATGAYGLDLGKPQQVQSGCLTVPGQRAAWSCDLADSDGIAIDIYASVGASTDGAQLNYEPPAYDSNLYYGTQASYMSMSWAPFLLVVDNDEPEDGLAFYFQGSYDKVVVVPEHAIPMPPGVNATKSTATSTTTSTATSNPTKTKREWINPAEFAIATPSSKPWFCFWNNTIVEGFIYVHEKAAGAPSTPTAAYTGPMTSTPPWARSESREAALISKWAATPTVTITTTITMAQATTAYTGVASAFPSWLKENFPRYNMSEYRQFNSVGRRKGHADKSRLKPRQPLPNGRESPAFQWSNTQQLEEYPQLVKLEESRRPGSPAPYCIQYQVLDDFQVNWVPDQANGERIVVHLTEEDPPYSAYQEVGLANPNRLMRKKRTVVPESCHCQWMSGQ